MLLIESLRGGSNPSPTAIKNYIMSRIEELKKQAPHFDFSYFDLFRRIDPTKSGKYIPVLSKVMTDELNNRISDMEHYHQEISSRLLSMGYDISSLSTLELWIFTNLLDFVGDTQVYTIKEFIDYMERGLIDNKDVLTYKNLNEIRNAVSLASLKEDSKLLETQIHKEHEDDNWLILRPLSFEASSKYGSSTKWCTTYKREKEYFAKYFSRGVLVYFINKNTGYKFAMYSEVYDGDNEISFWGADDKRVDFFNVEVDTYLTPIIRRLANSKIKNSDLLSEEEKDKVMKDCGYYELKVRETLRAEVPYEDQIPEPNEIPYDYPDIPMGNITITTNNDYAGDYLVVNTTTSTLATPNYIYNEVPEEDCRA